MANCLSLLQTLARHGLCAAGFILVSAAPLKAQSLPPSGAKTAIPATSDRLDPVARIDMQGESASEAVIAVAGWIMRTNQQNGNPFIIADKLNGHLFAFLENGTLLAKSRALYGAARSDAMTQEQADKTLAELAAGDMITPAGIFPAHGYVSPTYGASIRFAEYANSNLLIHRAPAEWRRKNLQAAVNGKVHVTFGCINVLPEFMDKVLLPVFNGASTIFILPELAPVRQFFAIDDTRDEALKMARK